MIPAFFVGDIPIANPLVLAPMEDVSNLAFRLLAKEIGQPGLMFTEFVSAMAIHHGAVKTLKKMRIEDAERPLGIQIFGADPAIMADTARLCQDMGADIVDINMGCWVPKVCRTGSGAALLKDPDLAADVVQAVVRAVSIPVTVKVRAGWDYSQFTAPELARRFQDAGIKMMTLHARFAKQGFEGQADWELIARLRESLTIPLLGNGDVKTAQDAVEMMQRTGCDGVMVGRAAISSPWNLASIRAGLAGEPQPPEPTVRERAEMMMRHARLMVMAEGGFENLDAMSAAPSDPDVELRSLRALRGQLPLYLKGFAGASASRASLARVSSLAELQQILDQILALPAATQ